MLWILSTLTLKPEMRELAWVPPLAKLLFQWATGLEPLKVEATRPGASSSGNTARPTTTPAPETLANTMGPSADSMVAGTIAALKRVPDIVDTLSAGGDAGHNAALSLVSFLDDPGVDRKVRASSISRP